MKPRFSNQTNHALTLVEVLVVLAVLLVLTAMLLPVLAAAKRRVQRIHCVNNMKDINVAYRDCEADHGSDYPMSVSVTNGGTMELNNGKNAWINFAVLSNELSRPGILHCPADTERIEATNFNDLNGKISYFINLTATEVFSDMPVFGDDNFAVNGVPVKSGLLEFSSNTLISWTSTRHKFVGNISFVDGSVAEFSNSELLHALEQTGPATNSTPLSQQPMLQEALQAHNGVATNRLAIP